MISVRQFELLQRLINASGPVFGKKIAESFKVSERTVRNDINTLNDYLKPMNMTIRANPRLGYWIDEKSKSDLSSLMIQKRYYSTDELPSDNEEREIYLYCTLFENDFYVTMGSLAEEIFVSKTTISKDISNMKNLITLMPDISLEVSKTNGIRLIGKEAAVRKMISAVILYYFDLNPNFLTHSIHHFFDPNNKLYTLYHTLKSSKLNADQQITQKSLKMFSMEVIVSAYRSNKGFTLDNYPGSKLSNFPKKEIEKMLNAHFNTYDLRYFEECLRRKRLYSSEQDLNNENKRNQGVIDDFCKLVSEKYHLDISDDEEIISHLRNTFSVTDISFRKNDIDIEDVRLNYPFACEIADQISPIVEKQLNTSLSDRELCRLALHIQILLDKKFKKIPTVLITNSRTYERFVKSRIERYFNQTIDLLGSGDPYRLSYLCEKHKPKLILSTVMFENTSGIDMLYISPILSQSNILNINNYIYSHAKYK